MMEYLMKLFQLIIKKNKKMQLKAIYKDDFTDWYKEGYYDSLAFPLFNRDIGSLPQFQFNFPSSSTLTEWKLVRQDKTEVDLSSKISLVEKTTVGSIDNFFYKGDDLEVLFEMPSAIYQYYLSDGTNEVWSEWFYKMERYVPTIELKTTKSGTFSMTLTGGLHNIDWGDDSSSSGKSGVITHTYADSTEKTITITNNLDLITSLSARNQSLTSVENLNILIALTNIDIDLNSTLSGILNLSGITTLINGRFGDTSLTEINIEGCANFIGFYPSYNQTFRNNPSLTVIRLNGCTSLQRIYLSNCNLINSLTNLNTCSSLTRLIGLNNRLGEINVTGLTSLTWLQLVNNFYLTEIIGLSTCIGLGILNTQSCYRYSNAINVPAASGMTTFNFTHMSFTSTEVDDTLINANNANLTNCTITGIAGNTARTSASDVAVAALLARGCTYS